MRIKYLHEFLVAFLSLDNGAQRQIRKKLDELHRMPEGSLEHQALRGDQFKGLFKLRVGDWRLIHKIVDGELLFITLGHRSEVYRG
ncbi:MAG: type II toxin-antitoxin system RelE/ParE family toxin [Deltaproteobacteria bacterium]|nr:type II toxin-antitoxin system RelE/ParE family toxin [Deltaproteobacteria bacterium]